ncbi:MAG: hypothetical protein EPN38_06005 [Rhodanobacteraceae bacterium]|nr:MAG: hypothetical protein EPN38_06005 [Rhodanobacteraceae bacterium]
MYLVLAIALPLITPVVILLLLSLLRELLRVPGLKHVPDEPAYMPQRSDTPTGSDQWRQITARWNGWITGPLTFMVGALVVALVVGLLAYLGWIATWVVDRPYAITVAPLSFGGWSSLLLSTLFGFVTLVLGVPIVGFAGFALHWIGRHTLWPNPCGKD